MLRAAEAPATTTTAAKTLIMTTRWRRNIRWKGAKSAGERKKAVERRQSCQGKQKWSTKRWASKRGYQKPGTDFTWSNKKKKPHDQFCASKNPQGLENFFEVPVSMLQHICRQKAKWISSVLGILLLGTMMLGKHLQTHLNLFKI